MEGITVMEPPPMVRLYRGHMLFTLLGSNPATAVYAVVREDGIVAQRRSGINVPTAWTLQITQALERLKIMIAEGVLSPFYDDAITAYDLLVQADSEKCDNAFVDHGHTSSEKTRRDET